MKRENEPDFDLEGIFADIDTHLKNGPQEQVKDPVTESKKRQILKGFNQMFLQSIYNRVYLKSDPKELAPSVKTDFTNFVVSKQQSLSINNAPQLSSEALSEMSLEGVAQHAINVIDELERSLVDTKDRTEVEQKIRKLEIFQRACLEANNLPDFN